MSESISRRSPEQQMTNNLFEIAARYLDVDDISYLGELEDFDERIGYVYGRIVDLGLDPEELLFDYGILDGGNYEI